MKAFFYDTETTGIPDYGSPSDAEHQPHIVQAAAVLVDLDTRQIEAAIDLIVRPDGWTIPEEAAAIHGISTERAETFGVPEATVTEAMLQLWRRADVRIGHNQPFDARILRIALKRFTTEEIADEWKAGASECTASLSSPILNLPPTEAMRTKTSFKRKTPTLSEAYLHFTGTPHTGAHGALPDVSACMTVYWGCKDGARC